MIHFCARQVLWLLAAIACASPVTYTVSANTSSLAGTSGSLDFNFNPGPLVTQSATVQIVAFNSDGTPAAAPLLTGNVSGALPGSLTFNNGTPFNDYFQTFTFDKQLTFQVSLSGPALSSPDGVSTSGSTFAFSLFSDPAGTIPVLTSDAINGFAFTVEVNLDGSTTATNFLPTDVPEPGSAKLAGSLLTTLVLRLMRRRFARPWKAASLPA